MNIQGAAEQSFQKVNRWLHFVLAVGVWACSLVWLSGAVLAQSPGDTAFTLQARLQVGGRPVSGVCRLDFYLFDAAVGGNQLGSAVSKSNVVVADGYFTVVLDFGDVFSPDAPRYLEIRNIDCGRAGDPVNLTGRMPLFPAPTVYRASRGETASAVAWNNIVNMPAGFADNQDNGVDISCADNETLKWVGGISGGWTCSAAVTDHGSLSGLGDDDHPQYLLSSGTRPMAGSLDMQNHPVENVAPAQADGQAVVFEQAVKVNDVAGGDLSGSYPTGIRVVGLQGRPVASTPPLANQVLTWDGSAWTAQDSQAGGPAGGDLSQNYPNPRVRRLQGFPVSSTAPLNKQVLRWNDSAGQYEPVNVLSYGDAAGGDLAGTFPNPAVVRIQGRLVSNSTPLTYQVLTWNASAAGGGRWEPADPQIIGPAGGDLSGTFPNPTVAKLQGNAVNNTAPASNQILTWTGAQWAPANVSTLQANPVNDAAPADNQVLTWNGSEWEPAAVKSLQGRPVMDVDPANGQALQWNGTIWKPATVMKPGDTLGGDLEGTIPAPQLGADVAGMPEVDFPMGYGDHTAPMDSSEEWLFPPEASFTPDAPGKCMVFASAYIGTGGSAGKTPVPFVRTARKVGSGSPENDSSTQMIVAPESIDSNNNKYARASANYVWIINPGDVGQQVQFGCYIYAETTSDDWFNDETVNCRVSFICM